MVQSPTSRHDMGHIQKHFSDALKNLLKIRGNTIQNTSYHQANQAIQKLTKQFAEMRIEVLSSVNVF